MRLRGSRSLGVLLPVAMIAIAGCVTVSPGGSTAPSSLTSLLPSVSVAPSLPSVASLPALPTPTQRPSPPPATPTPAQATAVATPTATPTELATASPAQPTATAEAPTATAEAPTGSPEAPTPTAGVALDFTLPAVYGSTALESGFEPDPFTVDASSDGPVDVAYLASNCVGWTTSAPSFSVTYTEGDFDTLRFYFISEVGDTTMVINTPGGDYVCNDDFTGTTDPLLDFDDPAGGRYDVWIGSYLSDGADSGTLYVTESTSNSP